MNCEDLDEVDQLIAFLKAKYERERQGLSIKDVADRTGLQANDLLALEGGRNSSPALAILTRYARALGRRVILSLHMGEPFVAAMPSQPAS
jgi:transcriptional regulator with XRE-family HTH domain